MRSAGFTQVFEYGRSKIFFPGSRELRPREPKKDQNAEAQTDYEGQRSAPVRHYIYLWRTVAAKKMSRES